VHDPPEHGSGDGKRSQNDECQLHRMAILNARIDKVVLYGTRLSTGAVRRIFSRRESFPDLVLLQSRSRKPRIGPEDREPSGRAYAEPSAIHGAKNFHVILPDHNYYSVLEH
jgi:hypothetical protein